MEVENYTKSNVMFVDGACGSGAALALPRQQCEGSHKRTWLGDLLRFIGSLDSANERISKSRSAKVE
jgi:hypothetical protein